MAGGDQTVALALAPRTFVITCKRFKDGGRLLLRMRLCPLRRAHSFRKNLQQFEEGVLAQFGAVKTQPFRGFAALKSQ
eukprot:3866018-Pyramimonas_sp.AAC.1